MKSESCQFDINECWVCKSSMASTAVNVKLYKSLVYKMDDDNGELVYLTTSFPVPTCDSCSLRYRFKKWGYFLWQLLMVLTIGMFFYYAISQIGQEDKYTPWVVTFIGCCALAIYPGRVVVWLIDSLWHFLSLNKNDKDSEKTFPAIVALRKDSWTLREPSFFSKSLYNVSTSQDIAKYVIDSRRGVQRELDRYYEGMSSDVRVKSKYYSHSDD